MLHLRAHYTDEHTVIWNMDCDAAWNAPRTVRLCNVGGLVWRGYQSVTLTLSSAIAPQEEEEVQQQHQQAERILDEQMLQSALQKAVRRSEPDVAVRAAVTLAQQNPVRFLRRLVIVLVEDAYLHTCVQSVVWLMVAHTLGYRWTSDQRDRCFRLVHWMASQPRIEHLHTETSDQHWHAATADGAVLALAIRASYGGMTGDMAMLWRLICRWSHRIAINAPLQVDQTPLPMLSPLTTVPFREHSELPRECVDFHVAREQYMIALRDAIEQHGLAYDADMAKSALWYHRSGVYVGKRYVPDGSAWEDAAEERRGPSRAYYEHTLSLVLDGVDRRYLNRPLLKRQRKQRDGAGNKRKCTEAGSILAFTRRKH